MFLFDVQDGNPNGDPDAGNLPRVDQDTMQGLVTDVALKRKVRDYVTLTRGMDPLMQIYVKHRGILTNQQKLAYDALELTNTETKDTKEVENARDWMCKHFFDVRMFGAVMSTKKYNSGQVRGAVQMTFARSFDPVTPQDISITRVALTNSTDVRGGSEGDDEARSGQMGRKAYLPYGLYRSYGFVNSAFSAQTGVSEEDLALLWESLIHMWTVDRSASRGFMACRGLYVFSHNSQFGSAQAQDLFELVRAELKNPGNEPRHFHDYDVSVDSIVPSGVTLTRLVG